MHKYQNSWMYPLVTVALGGPPVVDLALSFCWEELFEG